MASAPSDAAAGDAALIYPHAVEPNDPSRHGRPAGPAVRFCRALAVFPVHTRDGIRWWMEDSEFSIGDDRPVEPWIVRDCDTFERAVAGYA